MSKSIKDIVGKAALVVIEWEDACTRSGWVTTELLPDKLRPSVVTVGWVIHRDEGEIAVCQSVVEDGDCGDVTCVPMGMVRRIRTLKV